MRLLSLFPNHGPLGQIIRTTYEHTLKCPTIGPFENQPTIYNLKSGLVRFSDSTVITLSLSLSFSWAKVSRSLLASSRSASRCWSLAVSWTFLSLASDSSSGKWNWKLNLCDELCVFQTISVELNVKGLWDSSHFLGTKYFPEKSGKNSASYRSWLSHGILDCLLPILSTLLKLYQHLSSE